MSKEAKIGAAVILGLALLFFFAPSGDGRNNGLFANRYQLVFKEVPGLEVNGNVKMAGVDIGYVTDLDFCTPQDRKIFGPDANVVVSIATDFYRDIPVDSSAGVVTVSSSLLWLEITPGISEKSLESGTKVRLRSIPSAGGGLADVQVEPLRRLQGQLREVRKLAQDKRMRNTILDMAANARFLSNELRIVSKDTNRYLALAYDSLDSYDRQIVNQLERFDLQIAQSRETLSKLTATTKSKSSQWRQQSEELNNKLHNLGQLAVAETERYRHLSAQAEERLTQVGNPQIVAKLHRAARKSREYAQIAEDLHYITSEPSTQEALKGMAAKYKDQAKSIDDLLRKIESIIPGSIPEE